MAILGFNSGREKRPLPNEFNVCIVARRFPVSSRASGFSFLRLIAKGLAARGHSVTVLAAEQTPGIFGSITRPEVDLKPGNEGIKVHFLLEGPQSRSLSRRVGGRGEGRDPFPALVREKFLELHRERPFHLVHSVDNSAMTLAKDAPGGKFAIAYDVAATQMSEIFSLMGRGQETLGSILGTSLAVGYKFLRTYYSHDRQLLKTADGVFVASPRERIALERYYLYPDARIHMVPYGIEIGALDTRERSDELRKRLGIPETAKVATTVTDMTELAEVQNLMRAFEQVVIKKPSSRLIIVGQGPKYKEIERAALDLALGSKVIFAGEIRDTDLPDFIALSDVFVNLSSRTTGFEPSLLEAMAQKKVIIGSEVSPMGSIVEHSQEGFLIRPADVAELTTLLLDIFAGHLSVTEIGEAARRKVLDLFDPEKMVMGTLKAYEAILNSTGFYLKARSAHQGQREE